MRLFAHSVRRQTAPLPGSWSFRGSSRDLKRRALYAVAKRYRTALQGRASHPDPVPLGPFPAVHVWRMNVTPGCLEKIGDLTN